MPDTKTATRPSRKRAETTAKVADKPKASKAKTAEAVETVTDEPEQAENVQRIRVVMEHAGDTKTYSKWQPPQASGCVGTYYAPLGTMSVRVLLEGPAS